MKEGFIKNNLRGKVWPMLLLALALLCNIGNTYALKADFTITNASGCSPLLSTFTNTSSGASASAKAEWRFGNGNKSNTYTSVGAIYYTPGFYSVTLVITDGSVKDSITKTNAIQVYRSPVANISATPPGGCAPLTVKYKDISTQGSGKITKWVWDFGDGNIDSVQNPVNIYQKKKAYTVSLIVTDINGCTDNVTKNSFINVSTQMLVNFTSTDSVVCRNPLTTKFKALLTAPLPPNLSYFWDFGDGNTSTSDTPTHTYSFGGKYTVKLSVSDTTGCSGTKIKVNYINIGREIADFKISTDSGCTPFNVNFINNSTPSTAASKYYWTFGDGGISTLKAPSHAYSATGSYSVKLRVQNAAGCLDSITKSGVVKVLPNPTADFTAKDSLFCKAPLAVIFKDLSKNAVSWNWNFGDGFTSTLQNPAHTYKVSGKYTISLKIKSKNGCSDTRTKVEFIRIVPPVASINLPLNQGCKAFSTQFFNASATIDTITRFHWDFGDGDTSNLRNPQHIYLNTGKYTARLIIWTAGGCGDTTTYSPVKVGVKPASDFSGSPRIKCNDTVPVKFKNLTNTKGGVMADSFFWQFGDGGVSSDSVPRHVYDAKPKKYPITLVAWSNGCSDTLIKANYIEILPAFANFTYMNATCRDDSVHFKDTSEGATSILWHFDDGSTSTLKYPSKVFSPGLHRVVLYAFNNVTGCRDTFFSDITVQPRFKTFLSAVDSAGCPPLSIHFIDSSSLPIQSIFWDFGNGKTDTVENPVSIYDTSGYYDVKMRITTTDGCTQSLIKKKFINVNTPLAKFSVSNDGGCTPFQLTLFDSSTTNIPFSARIFDLGDGRTILGSGAPLTITYPKAPKSQKGGYEIKMVVVDQQGCRDTVRHTVYPTHPTANIRFNPVGNCTSLTFEISANIPDSNGAGPYKYFWDYGNGVNSQFFIKRVTFASVGTYKILLAIQDKNFCPDTVIKMLLVDIKKPVAKFSAAPTSANCPPLKVNFLDSSQGASAISGIADRTWYFGDGSSSNLIKPVKIYQLPGTYSVSLKVVDSNGCTDSIHKTDLISIKGPTAIYSFDKKQGCTPLTVNFTASGKGVVKYTWDMGDGAILSGTTNSHTFDTARNYIPSLIVKDSTGCQVSLPPRDTIVVNPPPKPDFTFIGTCANSPIQFVDSSQASSGFKKAWLWDFGDSTPRIAAPNPKHSFSSPGWYRVRLTVTNSKGCTSTRTKSIHIQGVKVNFEAKNPTGCVGSPVLFKDKSIADTSILSWRWKLGDGDTSTLKNPTHTYKKKGIYPIFLEVMDIRGCSDTLTKPHGITIGDTVLPPPPPIYHVSVVDDRSVEISFSKYRDIDFKSYSLYRETSPGKFTQVMTTTKVDDTLFTERGLNTLRNSYGYKLQVNTFCGFSSLLSKSRPHYTVEIKAFAGVNLSHLFWNSYKGWDSVSSYSIYRQDTKDPKIWNFVANVPGGLNSFTDTSVLCYAKNIYKILAQEWAGNNQVSWSDTTACIPIHKSTIKANEIIRATVVDNQKVLLEWSDLPGFKIQYFFLYRSLDGKIWEPLKKPFPPTVFSLLDEDVKVASKSYFYRMRVMDSCGDMSNYTNIGKSILLNADSNEYGRPRIKWSAYEKWQQGIKFYVIERRNADGSFTPIDTTLDAKQLSYVDNLTDLNSLPQYCYRVKAVRDDGIVDSVNSTSNEDCTEISSSMFAPNAFSPNGDGKNDSFVVKGTYLKQFHLLIYTRWGELVFESKDIHHQWDGKFKGQACPMDVLIYEVEGFGIEGKRHFIFGNLTIIQ